jgi:MFS family permease
MAGDDDRAMAAKDDATTIPASSEDRLDPALLKLAGIVLAFRVVQGIGGGMLLPLLQAILAQAAGPQRLGRLIAAIAVPALLAPVVGSVASPRPEPEEGSAEAR